MQPENKLLHHPPARGGASVKAKTSDVSEELRREQAPVKKRRTASLRAPR